MVHISADFCSWWWEIRPDTHLVTCVDKWKTLDGASINFSSECSGIIMKLSQMKNLGEVEEEEEASNKY
jgi:hypothetical protein